MCISYIVIQNHSEFLKIQMTTGSNQSGYHCTQQSPESHSRSLQEKWTFVPFPWRKLQTLKSEWRQSSAGSLPLPSDPPSIPVPPVFHYTHSLLPCFKTVYHLPALLEHWSVLSSSELRNSANFLGATDMPYSIFVSAGTTGVHKLLHQFAEPGLGEGGPFFPALRCSERELLASSPDKVPMSIPCWVSFVMHKMACVPPCGPLHSILLSKSS